ncbi:MAG TPA: LacI family DNA-binding transcriptional regulator [Candidatus Sumerlaeota bacterium]|nr:LacI family DNA-binding transcriptional regulator [Candidatus Sumerlaeota bacterium]
MIVKRTKPTTMAMIAEKAGVARTTVSFILNGRYRERGISEKTAQRVRSLAEAMSFVPSETARSLSRRRSGMIGVILPGFNSAWGESIITGIRSRLHKMQTHVPLIAAAHDDDDWEEREIKLLIERGVEAIVCCATVRAENHRRIVERGVPFVFVGHRAKGIPDASFVAWDGARVAAAATRHLIGKGRRRIAFLGNVATNPAGSEHYQGHRQALMEAKLTPRPEWRIDVPRNFDDGGMMRAVFSAAERPDALISDSWQQALHAIEELDARGLSVPEDVSLLALGDAPICRHGRIQLSAVVEPAEQIGGMAAEIALKLIADPSRRPIQQLVADYKIIDRATT